MLITENDIECFRTQSRSKSPSCVISFAARVGQPPRRTHIKGSPFSPFVYSHLDLLPPSSKPSPLLPLGDPSITLGNVPPCLRSTAPVFIPLTALYLTGKGASISRGDLCGFAPLTSKRLWAISQGTYVSLSTVDTRSRSTAG
ncbi:hypothetical protein GALMADRAFT_225973 [Galerina marginata CBS 339.88]|uniref:Uncharacterized protein n=1 Tax=Galerina marginata (strain CBS 339.88) TaxID=685588 RepID=A0A067SZB2_GALM3|nr:hypothetical protein GALMADRAFT_225973 [Galerina marginata CBS 339.88]